jgi:hypothetical protein
VTLFAGPVGIADPLVTKLLVLIRAGLDSKDDLRNFLDAAGIERDEIDFDGAPATARKNTVIVLARQGKLRLFVEAMLADANFGAVAPKIRDLIALADVLGDTNGEMTPQEHIHVAMVGVRPFVNRIHLRDNLEAMFVDSGSRVMAVDGPRSSGRSYTWVLVQYVARQIGRQAKLVDLTTFRDTQATPADVAIMIAVKLGWDKPDDDVTSQDYTKGRLVLGWFIQQVEEHGPVCLVIDGLDGANLAEATVTFVCDIATAAGNDELGESVIVLLAFGRPLTDPSVEPFVLREPPLAALPGSEITTYLQTAALKSAPLSNAQAKRLAEKLFGKPLPASLPVSALRDKAGDLSRAVLGLLKGDG